MRKKVIIAGFFPPPITGQGLATERLAGLLAESIDVISLNLRERETTLNLRKSNRFFQKIADYKRTGAQLKGIVEDNPGATVIWTAVSPELLGHFRDLLTIMPAFRAVSRVYGVVHWGRFSKLFRSVLSTYTARKMIQQLAGVVFLNQDRAEDCRPWIPDSKRVVIPNTLDEAVICSDEEVETKQFQFSKQGPLRVLFLSNMIREKGYLDVLEAIRILHNKGIALHATFVGQWMNSEDQQFFEKKVRSSGLEQTISHLGIVQDRNKIKTLHLEAQVFILPSYMIEGQPLTIIEAMNAGSPVIASNNGGIVDMIQDQQEGYLVEPQDTEAIANAIELLTNKEVLLAQSKAARARYLRAYAPEIVLNQWLKLLT